MNRGPILSPSINIGNRVGPQSAAPPASANQKKPSAPPVISENREPWKPPPSTPKQPTYTPQHDFSKDFAEIRKLIAELKVEVATKAGVPGKDGRDGEPGAAGKQGPQGPAGPAGRADEARIAALEAQIAELRRLLAQRPTAQPPERVRVEEVD